MIQCRDEAGRTMFLGRPDNLKILIDWLGALLVAAYGPEEGNRRLHKLPVRALSLWAEKSPLVFKNALSP